MCVCVCVCVVYFWTSSLMSRAAVCSHALLGHSKKKTQSHKKVTDSNTPLSRCDYLFGNATIIHLNIGPDHHLGIDENAMGDELRGSGGPPALPHAAVDPPRP